MKESDLQKAILIYLKNRNVAAWRINTTGLYDPRVNKWRPSRAKGFADIVGLLPCGRFFSIEVKTEIGRVSEEQVEFGQTVVANNGIYIVARSLDDVAFQLLNEKSDVENDRSKDKGYTCKKV